MRSALLAEFSSVAELVHAIQTLRARGHRDLEAYTPFPAHEVDDALGLRRSRLPFVVCAVGLSAAGGAYFLQWLLNAYLYPLNVGGRPPHFPLAYLIITFEMGILFSAFTAFFGVLGLGRLFKLWSPVFEAPGFERATGDRYWLAISAGDTRFASARDDLDPLRPLQVVELRDGRVV